MAEMRIRRLGILSVAKMYGLLLFIMGFIFGVIYGLVFIVFGAAIALGPRSESSALGGVSTVVIGLLIMIGVPIFYGLLGFIMGALMAAIYNLVARFAGGVQIELESVTPQYAPPPPPQQWGGNQ
jgi:hypothetical protein